MLRDKDKGAIGRRIAALLSLVFLVPVVRKIRERRAAKSHRHFPIFGH